MEVAAGADNIATFVEVVRQQSISAAARRLGLPKSTVSRRLQRLEQELSSQLLHRTARAIALTEAGRQLYQAVSAAVDVLGSAVAELSRGSQELSGTVRLTAPVDLGRMVLSGMLVAFLERYPQISLELVFDNRMVDLVQEGIHLAVRAGRVTGTQLLVRKLCESELQLAACPKLAERLAPLGIRILGQTPFVLHRAPSRVQHLKLERAGKQRQSLELDLSGRVSVDDYAALAELVARGQGVGLLPALHVQQGVEDGRLVRLFPPWFARSANVYLVSAGRRQPERVRVLAEFLRDAFAKLPPV